jgi:hypothetical protein
LYIPERALRGEEALTKDPTVQAFLRERYPWGQDAETLKRFHIGLEPNSWGLPAVLFPMKQLDSSWYYTRRSILERPSKYEHERGPEPPMYLPLPPQERVVFLTEGHSDTLTARWLGFKAMGLMGTGSWKSHLDYLQRFAEVRVVMDADFAGWKTAEALFGALCNVRIIFLYPPTEFVWQQYDKLEYVPHPDPRCTDREQGHGEHQRLGLVCQKWWPVYADLKQDLTDITKKHGRLWAQVLLTEGDVFFGPGHRTCSYLSRAGCRRCGARLAGSSAPQARLPQAGTLLLSREPRGLRRRKVYLGAGR